MKASTREGRSEPPVPKPAAGRSTFERFLKNGPRPLRNDDRWVETKTSARKSFSWIGNAAAWTAEEERRECGCISGEGMTTMNDLQIEISLALAAMISVLFVIIGLLDRKDAKIGR
jgi:hypothetical protein